MAEESKEIVAHLFRTEYGKLVAALTRIFGTSHIQLAEDIVQETLIAALNNWSVDRIPSNPTGWLVQVAKRKAINELKRLQVHQKHISAASFSFSSQEIGSVFLEDEIEDSQLRMIFTCCHPSLTVAAQIALTLKTLCGFGVREVANALLNSESTINKRLYRAKATIRNSNLPFTIPQGSELDSRLDAVALTLYLLFNEGYNSTDGNSVIRKELCLEAIRLAKLLVGRFDKKPKLCALLSLMCFHTARFDARIDDQGAIVLFEDQNRSLWNQELINIGLFYLKKSMGDQDLSAYHIEAGISAEHCTSESFETTDWQSIYHQYQLLEKIKPNPIITLNLAIIQSKLKGIPTSLSLLEKLANSQTLKNYYLLPATQGIFYMKLGKFKKAIYYLQEAQRLEPAPVVRKFMEAKILECYTRQTRNWKDN